MLRVKEILIVIAILSMGKFAFSEADIIVKNKVIDFLRYEVTASSEIARENRMELRSVGYSMTSTKIGATTEAQRDEVTTKMDELNMGYSVQGTTVTVTQENKKTELDGKFWTRSQVIRAGMPTP